jgi:hypothetical protein
MSVPPGTEMFQFPGFASSTYVFSERYPLPGGLPHSDIHGSTPARGSPWLFAACHVLHRLLVPRHPPNALLILDIPPPARPGDHHAQKPSSESVVRGQSSETTAPRPPMRTVLEILVFSATQHDPPRRPFPHCLRNHEKDPSARIVHRASEPSPSNRWGAIFADGNSRSDKSARQRDRRSIQRQILSHTRPETHQNLIHSCKEQTRPPKRPHTRRGHMPGTLCPGR